MRWWRHVFHRKAAERELDEELRFHLELHARDLIAQGHSPEEAHRRARLALGGPEQVKEMCRDARGTRWLEDLWQDLRYGARMLIRQPAFTAVAALALALGIGVNTAILSAVNGFVLRPLPVESPAELIAPHWGRKAAPRVWGQFSYQNYLDLRDRNQSFSELCAWSETSAGISSSDSRSGADTARAEVAWGELVSGNYFAVMGVKPVLGRTFLPEEDHTPNAHPVVILSHSLWQRRFAADPAIVGRTVHLNGLPFTVVGVMPQSFLGSRFYVRLSFWVPLMMSERFGRRDDWRTDRSRSLFNLYGRLKPGVTIAQAERELNVVADELGRLHPRENVNTKVQLTTELDGRYADATGVLKYGGLLAVCVSALVLLVACANVANLMLARAVTRAREIGVRLAIGAGRPRIVRQLLTESVFLAVMGALPGWALAWWGTQLIRATAPPVPYPLALDFAPDGYVLRWMLLVTLLTGVIFGLAPALLAARTDLVAVIKGAPPAQSRRRRWDFRSALVVGQVTISVIVLICAGLFIRSLGQAVRTDPGFKLDNLVTMMINPRLLAYDQQATARFFRELLQRMAGQPGVRSASLVSDMPLMAVNTSPRGPLVREGDAPPPPNQGVSSELSVVAPGYFDTVRTPLVVGRDFTTRDDAHAPAVVIVNQEFARRFYGSAEAAMGKRVRLAEGPFMEIVAVASDGRYGSLYEDRQIYLFLPLDQNPRSSMTLLISAHESSALAVIAESARREIARLDARLPVIGLMMAEENMSLAYWGPRVAAGMASAFGVLALLLATMGLYSVMSYVVSQRTREVGIRVALGASLQAVLRLVVSQGMRLVCLGVVLGLLGALAATRMLARLLLGVGRTDPVTFVGVPLLLLAVALLACYLPARRAARVDPLVALRQE
jgi:predicted permease